MKVTSVSGPGAVQDLSTPEHVRTARMMAAYTAPQAEAKAPPAAQEYPVANANKISAEEVSAIKPAQSLTNRDNPPTETAEEVETPPAKDPVAEQKFAQIARQERALRAKIQQANTQLKQREAALAAREAALTAAPAQQDLSDHVPRSRLQQDALTVLEEAGVDFNELTNQAINRQPTDPRVMSTIQKLEAKIAQLEESNTKTAKSYEEQQQNNYQAAVKQISRDVQSLVNSDPEFETVKAMNASKDVVELITKTFNKTGEILSVEDAAKEVEEYLLEEGLKITQLSKVQKRMAAANASRTPTEEKPQALKQQQPMKTLTNTTGSMQKSSVRDRAIARANGFTGDF